MKLALVLLLALVLVGGYFYLRGPDTASLDEREQRFAEQLNGVELVGHHTFEGREGFREERYEIEKVTKTAGDVWLIHARFRYNDRDFTAPIPIPVEWAGNTPVLSLTDLTIPGLSTYTARVMIYQGTYAGMWKAKDHGGLMFGAIRKLEAGGGNQ
jgi:hypothetical protein